MLLEFTKSVAGGQRGSKIFIDRNNIANVVKASDRAGGWFIITNTDRYIHVHEDLYWLYKEINKENNNDFRILHE